MLHFWYSISVLGTAMAKRQLEGQVVLPVKKEEKTETRAKHSVVIPELLKVLTPEQVMQIDRALGSVGPFGEVRLVKVRGRLRFIQQLDSYDLLRSDRASEAE